MSKDLGLLRTLGITLSKPPPQLDSLSWIEPPTVVQADLAPMNLIQIGAFTGIYGGRVGHSRIGRYCSIAPGVDIASDQHPTNWISSSMLQYVGDVHGWGTWLATNGYNYTKPQLTFRSNSSVQIGNDVWIGKNAIIRSGVTIGDGAVIAAGAVVVGDVPPYAIAAGVPARIKKYRFSESTVAKLLELQWWNFNIFDFAGLRFDHVDACIELIEQQIASGKLMPYSPDKVHLS